jgi:hypothetical protein
MPNGIYDTVHDLVSSAVDPARAISRRCHLARTGIGKRDEIFPTGQVVPVDDGNRHHFDLSPRLKTAQFKNLWKVFYLRAANDLDHFFWTTCTCHVYEI